jgi:O-antigen ligase
MSVYSERVALPGAASGARSERSDLLEILFFGSGLIALLNPSVIKAFTAYDAATIVLAFLVLAGPVRMRWIPMSLRIAAAVLVFAGFISAFRATVPVEAITQVLQYIFVFAVQLPLVLTLARSRRTVHGMLIMICLSYLAVVLLTMFNQVERGGRVLAFHKDENANALALPTVFLSPFLVFFAFEMWRRGRRILLVCGGAAVVWILLWALTASASRGSTAATIVALAIFVPFRHGFQLRPRVLLNIAAVFLVVVAVGGFVYWTELPSPTLKKRIEAALSGPEEDAVVDERVALDRAGLRAFVESPLIGTGFDNFSYVAQFYDDSASFHAPHNVFIQFLAQAGLLGAGAFLFIMARWFALLLRTQAITTDRSQRELLWAFIAAMTGILTHAIAAPLVLQRHYWLLYGLGLAAALRAVDGTEWAPQQQTPAPVSDR